MKAGNRITELNITHGMRQHNLFMRSIAATVVLAIFSLSASPAIAAVRQVSKKNETAKPRIKSDEEQFGDKVNEIEATINTLHGKLKGKQASQSEQSALRQQRNELEAAHAKVMANFAEVKRKLTGKNLPKEIIKRHDDAVARYLKDYRSLTDQVDAIEKAKDDTERETRSKALAGFLKSKQKPKHRDSAGPNDFSNGMVKPDRNRKPMESKKQWKQAGLFNNPYVKLAATGPFTFDKLPGASDPAYLGESDEVVISDHIKAKAEELQHDPVKIYYWVRNNVDWIPSWGAAQEAEITLGSQRGNAMDIASLLIALYRASGIPARYVHGTIDVPEANFRSWAGGFNSIEAAADYASANGIPVTTVTNGGKVTKVRIEHIWVEAAIDFKPSRGAVNLSADTWVALDPSFKQHKFLNGLDLTAISGIDTVAIGNSLSQSGASNELEGWVQSVDATPLINAQSQLQSAVEAHISTMNNPTVGDVIGGREIVKIPGNVLPTGLPYLVRIVGAKYGKIPFALQNRIQLAFAKDAFGEPLDPVEYSMARMNNRKITMSFRPATSADENALLALLPNGEITDPSQLPGSIPSYLVNVIPSIRVDGQIVKQGGQVNLGYEVPLVFGIRMVGPGSHNYSYPVDAGSYLAVALIEGNVSSTAVNKLQANLETTKSKLVSGNPTLIDTLSTDSVLGDIFYSGVLGYFGEYISMSNIKTFKQKSYHNLASGYGSIGYEPHVSYFFGIPRSIEPGGVVANIRVVRALGTDNNSATLKRNINYQTGILSSALENAVLEQIFTSKTAPGEAISAVKALEKANSMGQRIYQITQSNQLATLPKIHHDSQTMDEIRSAINAGKVVVTHTDTVSVDGWNGAGYIIKDPVTGDGSFKITGGKNGGFITGLAAGPSLFISALGIAMGLLGGGLLLLLLSVIAFCAWLYVIAEMQMSSVASCFNLGMVLGPLLFGLFGLLEVTLWIEAILFANDAIAIAPNLSSALECKPI